ncbi:hypothetical protein NP234_24135, partial [Salmonella enterica]|nr:hypothetical protein [Salmonella enterica]
MVVAHEEEARAEPVSEPSAYELAGRQVGELAGEGRDDHALHARRLQQLQPLGGGGEDADAVVALGEDLARVGVEGEDHRAEASLPRLACEVGEQGAVAEVEAVEDAHADGR